MSTPTTRVLSIGDITPLAFDDSQTRQAWDRLLTSLSNPLLADILEVRSSLVDGITAELRRRGFLHPPTHVLSPCVDPLNHETETPLVSYYGQQCSLVQSLIFHKMTILASGVLKRVFWVSPNVRKEGRVSDARRYATEFTQIDFESSDLDMGGCMELIEQVLAAAIDHVIARCGATIERISGRTLKPVRLPLARYDLEEEARKRGIPAKEVEAVLAREIDQPVFLTNIAREAYDARDDASGTFRNYDIIMPKVGEVLSGAEREFEYERLRQRMIELDYPLAYFEPVLRLAKEVGLKRSSGAGFGVERLVRAVLLLDDIAEIYPFPRVPGERIVL